MPNLASGSALDSATALRLLEAGLTGGEGLGDLAPVLALVETLPAPLVERLLVELLASRLEDNSGP